ncbi:hypothetical protein Tco_0847993 [Tanacetum coccineum]
MYHPLAPRALVFSTPPSSPLEPHPYLTTLDDLPPRNFNPPPPSLSLVVLSQGTNVSPLAPRAFVFSTPPSSPLEPHPYLTTLDNLSPRNSNPSLPSLSQGLSQTLPIPTPMDFVPSFPVINLSRTAIQNAQNVQNSLLPLFTATSPQMPPPIHFTTTSKTTIPPFRTSLPPSSTFVPLDQSLWMEGPILLNYKSTHVLIVNASNQLSIISKMR